MSVYVDPLMTWHKTAKWRFGAVSHMYADTPEKLHALARKIGLKRQWCSDVTQPHSDLLHYDLSPGARAKAVKAGAKPVKHTHTERYRLRAVNAKLVRRCKELMEEVKELEAINLNMVKANKRLRRKLDHEKEKEVR